MSAQYTDVDWSAFLERAAGKAHWGCGEPLGGHLTALVRKKNGKGQYVDIFSLYYRELEPKPF